MRRLLRRSVIWGACLGAILIAWMAGARSLSMLLDRLYKVEIESRPIEELGIQDANRGILRINDLPMSTAMPNSSPYPLEMKVDANRRFVVQSANHAIALGHVEGGGPVLAIKPQSGDKAQFQIEHSILSWPTPLDINFMTGHSPSWKRHVYYRLVWDRPDGGRLEMFWRYEQYFYENWASGFMTRAGTTGLIRVDIRP